MPNANTARDRDDLCAPCCIREHDACGGPDGYQPGCRCCADTRARYAEMDGGGAPNLGVPPTMTDPALLAALVADEPDAEAIIEAAKHAAAEARSGASSADVRTFAAALAYWATDGDAPPGAPANRALEQWVCRVIDRVDPGDAEMAIALADALVFLPRPGSADTDTIREVIDLLDATRHTFKSKQVARAKQLLLPLVS